MTSRVQVRFAATVYDTPDTLASNPGPQGSTRYAFVRTLAATYRWALGDVSTADGIAVIGVSGGAQGRWIRIRPESRGDDLPDADGIIEVGGNYWRVLAEGILTAPRVLLLGTVNAARGDVLTITRHDTSPNALTIDNAGPLGGTLVTLTGAGWLDAEFDGADWLTKRTGTI
tara:strand:- start:42 stop:557 length:516 start_codon:yes stop_codon:yes gene_type:complete